MNNPITGKRWTVYMGIPSNGTVVDFQSYMLRELSDRYSDEVELVFPKTLCQRMFHDYARNAIVEDFLDSGCDVLWFLDSDVSPPKHVLDLLVHHGDKWQAAAAPYPVFIPQPGEETKQIVFTLYKRMPGDEVKLAPCAIPESGVEFVDGAATGCLFIKREVFEKLEKPYFEHKYDATSRQLICGEDLGFCFKLAKLGIQFLVDYSMLCRHHKNGIDLMDVNNYAVSFANKHITACNAEMEKIKEQLVEVSKRFKRLKEKNDELQGMVAKGMASGLVNRDGKPLIYR